MTEGQMPSGQMEPKNPTSAAQETPKFQLQEMPYIPDGPASVGGTQASDLGLAQWNPWSQREGSTAIWAPTVTSRGENRLDLFAVGLDSQVYHQSWNGSQWSPWKGLGDPKSITPPAAVALGSNRLSVFWVGTDKQVYSRTGDGNQWGEVESLGGTVIHGVAATSWGTNRIDLFAVGTDSSLYQNTWNGATWSGWKILRFKGQERVEKSATCISAPAAVSWGANRIDIFTLGIDNAVYHAWGDGTSEWKGWENLGGPCIQGVAAASRGVNRLDLFAISTDTVGTDNHLYYRSGNGSNWSRWENLGGACISAPTAVAQGEKRLDVFVVGTRSAIWQKSWVKGDDTLGVSEVSIAMKEDNPGEYALNEVAKAATAATGLNIQLASAQDSAVGWFCANAHPMQELETIHQKVVRQAGRALPPGSDAKQEAEYKALKRFFPFQATEPELLAENPPIDDRSPGTIFRLAKNKLTGIFWELKNSALAQNNDPDYFQQTRQRLLNLVLEFDQVSSSFVDFPEHDRFKDANVPILIKVEESLTLWRDYLNHQAQTVQDLETACTSLISDVQMELDRAVEGLAKISMIFSIEPFYLFRLMVPFRVVSNLGVSQNDTRKASGTLTELINNNILFMEWVPLWLESKIVELDKALQELDPQQENLFFHLKGGRAQAALLKQPGRGQNDWDTGIVINPNLPAEYWHTLFNQVHNLVLSKLRKFKQEFFMLMNIHADDVTIDMVRNRWQADDDLIEVLGSSNLLSELLVTPGDEQGSCKAELIDIGIPRRDSIEAFEHWEHTRPYITRQVNNLPIPGHLYYVDEYVVMVREALAGQSPAPGKITKRIKRLFEILNLNNSNDPGLDDVVVKVRNEIAEKPIFTQSLGVIDRVAQPQYITRLMPVLLKQFMDAYNLKIEPGLASVFDRAFQNTSGTIPNIAIPPAITAGIDASWNPATHGAILQWIALASELSAMFELNFKDRAEFFGFGPPTTSQQRRTILESFIKVLYNTSIFSKDEKDLEVQFAVSGSFAAYLHAEYAPLESDLKARLDPVACIELTIFAWDSGVNPNIVRDSLILPTLNTYVSNPANPQFNVETGENGDIYIFWPREETLGHFYYHPLIVKISVKTISVETNFWPQLAFVRGFPVLSLRDLIREYDQKAAHAGEWGRVQRLKETSAILREMLTRFDY